MTPSDPDFGPRAPESAKTIQPETAVSSATAPPLDELELAPEPPGDLKRPPIRSPEPDYVAWLLQRICTHNPLYAVSAAFTLYGLQASFPASDVAGYAPKLAVSLAIYVVLLTGVAIFLRRLGTLWQDLRMVGLLVVLLLPMISVALDGLLLAAPERGRLYSLAGGLFAAAIGEALLHGLRIRLPFGYRLPYHLLMTLFFVYPILFAPSAAGIAVDPHDATLQWKLFGFATAAAAILLTGLIAILRGPEYVSQNGTPWRWPLYPTVIFAFLTFGVVYRAESLCRSFHPIGERESIFGPYFLVPLILVIGVLTLAAGLRNRSRATVTIGLLIPWCALVAAAVDPRGDVYYVEFLERFRTTTTALPPLVTLWIAVAIFAVAAAGRVRWAYLHLAVALVLLGFVGPQTTTLRAVLYTAGAQPWGPGLAAALLLVLGWSRRAALDIGGGAVCAGLAIVVLGESIPKLPVEFLWFHVLLTILLPTGVLWGARRGYGIRIATAVMLLAATAAWHFPERTPLFDEASWARQAWYPITVFAVTAMLAGVTRDRIFVVAVAAIAAGETLFYGRRGYLRLKQIVVGLDAIALGLVSLAAAVGVSLAKLRRERLAPTATTPGNSVAESVGVP